MLLSCLLFLAPGSQAAEISNGMVSAEVDERGMVKVTDLVGGSVWQQVAVGNISVSGPVNTDGNSIWFLMNLEGYPATGTSPADALFKVTFTLEPGYPELVTEFEPQRTTIARNWHEVRYPAAFLPQQTDKASIVYPHGTGMLLPARTDDPFFMEIASDYLYGGLKSYMPALGYTDASDGPAIMGIMEQFEPAMMYWHKVGYEGEEYYVFNYGWMGDREKIDRNFTIRWQFTSEGGYVGMAKSYRSWSDRQGWAKTLEEKRGDNPDVDKLVGAPIFWTNGTVEEMTRTLNKLQSNGIEYCALGLDDGLYDVLNIPSPAEQRKRRGLAQKVVDAGYVAYHYDNYRDAFLRDPAMPIYNQRNWDAYPHDIVVQRSGELLNPGFSDAGGVITPSAFMKYAQSHMQEDNDRYPWNARFIDCIGSCAFTEGVDWHPDRLFTSIYYTSEKRREVMEYSNSLGQLTATECGLDYIMPYTLWYDGAMSLVAYSDAPALAFTFQSTDTSQAKEVKVEDDAPLGGGTPYSLSESIRYRIPFWFLVYHDCAVGTWRWEKGMNVVMEHWPRMTLLNLLSGTPPIYRIPLQVFNSVEDEWMDTYNRLEPWLREIGYEEMTEHRFVTDDRYVQLTVFGSRKGVIVNFGNKGYQLPDGRELPPNGYAFFEGELTDGNMPAYIKEILNVSYD